MPTDRAAFFAVARRGMGRTAPPWPAHRLPRCECQVSGEGEVAQRPPASSIDGPRDPSSPPLLPPLPPPRLPEAGERAAGAEDL